MGRYIKKAYIGCLLISLIIGFQQNKVIEASYTKEVFCDDAYENYCRMVDSFTSYDGTIMYPDEYAGAYYDSGELVILLTNKKNVYKYLQYTEFKHIKTDYNYSYNELRKAKQTLLSFLEQNREWEYACGEGHKILNNIICLGIDQIQNKAYLGINDLHISDEEVIDLLEALQIDSDLFDIRYIEKIEENSSLDPGIHIDISGGNAGSSGFRCEWYDSADNDWVRGFVTCAHMALCIGNDVNIYGTNTVIGVTKARQFSGSIDAAFVKLTNSNYTLSNTIDTNHELIERGYITSYLTNMPISKKGYNGISSGIVVDPDYSPLYNDVQFNDFVKATYDCDSGDSGGVVYYTNSLGDCYVAGIHCAKAYYNDPNGNLLYTRSAFCKITNIFSNLGVNLY